MRKIDNLNAAPRRLFAGTHSHRSDIILIFCLTLLPCLFFWRLITPNPADRMQISSGDFTEQYFPLRAFTAQEWVRGRIPLWNPYLFGGQPALADIQSGALYPPHIIEALILGWGGPLLGQEIGFPVWALELQVIAHFSLAAVGTYLFVRHLTRRHGTSLRRARFGGVIASLVFTYGGYLTGFPVQQITILAVSAWLPWVMWGLSVVNGGERRAESGERGAESGERAAGSGQRAAESGQRSFTQSAIRSPHSIAWAGLAFALAILAGHPQTVLYIFYLSLAYSLFQAWLVWSEALSAKASFRYLSPSTVRFFALRLIPWLLIVLLGSLLAAAQLLPTLEFIRRSLRADLSYQAVSAGLPLNEVISILYPGFFGGSPEYVGIASLVLIALALVVARPRREIFFWTGAGLLSFLLVFGGNTFLYPVFYLLAPGFEAVRQQERAFLVYSFSAAILAGYGAVALTGSIPKLLRSRYSLFERRLRVIMGVALGLTGFFIYGSAAATARGDEVNLFFGVLRHHLFGLLFGGGMILILALRPRRQLRLRGPWGMSLIAVWVGLNLFTVNWRFNLEEPGEVAPFTPDGVTQFLQNAIGGQKQAAGQAGRIVSGGLLPGGNSAALVYMLQDLTGNTPLQLQLVDTFFQQMPAWRLWQLMNVHYIVADRDLGGDGLSPVFEEGDHRIFQMSDPFPRVWLVAQTETIPAEARAIARLASDDFDLHRIAIVPDHLDDSLQATSSSSATISYFTPTRLTVTVDTSEPQFLVLSQIFYPGWQAKINGQPAKLLRTNVIQQGVVIPAGKHRVELIFQPNSFRLGVIISILGGIIWLALLLLRL